MRDGESTGTESARPSSPGKEDEDEMETLEGSAVKKKEDETSVSEPRKIIPLDRALFPDAEIEGEAKKEEKKPKRNGEFVDYQLEAARRLMRDFLDYGKDFFAPDSGMPAQTQSSTKETTAPAAS